MSKQYVKHNREIIADHLHKYGKLATHDIHVPILLLYELGKIKDKNGTDVNINRDFIMRTLKATNSWITKKHKSPFAKFKSAWNKPIEDVEAIALIKNHNTEDVDGTVGHLKGLLYTEEVDGILALKATGVIKDIYAKEKVEGDVLRNTSIGTRADGSIKEVSFVINEAAPHGGLEMAEDSKDNDSSIKPSSKKEIQLSEEIKELQFQEFQLDNLIIPNHMILSKMIKTGQIEPWKYDDLITTPTETLQLMEHAIPKISLGLMYGTNREPVKITHDEMDKVVNSTIDKYKTRTGKNEKKQPTPKMLDVIKQEHSFEEVREKELKHILELAEYSLDVAKKYIATELGESIEKPIANDKYLTDYLKKSKEIKGKLKQLHIQLGECEHE